MPSNLCSVVECTRLKFAKGLCQTHYMRQRYGKPENFRRPIIERNSAGEGSIHNSGYLQIRGIQRHRELAEKALGRPLPAKAIVHHFGINSLDNDNLVICPDQAYHMLIHKRTRALEACGHADYIKCGYCNKWEDPKDSTSNMRITPTWAYHRECYNQKARGVQYDRRS